MKRNKRSKYQNIKKNILDNVMNTLEKCMNSRFDNPLKKDLLKISMKYLNP